MVRYSPPEDWQQWVEWLAAGLHGRNRWRLSCVLMGLVFGRGRRTATAWLRAVGIGQGFGNYYYFLQPLGRKSSELAERLLTLLLVRLETGPRVLLAVDDSPTKRYGPKVQGAGIHHNPTPGPVDQKFLYGHVWVTISLVLRHPLWHTIALPLVGLLYVRAKDVAKLPAKHGWTFRTKLQLAVERALAFARLAQTAGKTVWIVADGAYAKRPFLRPLRARGLVVVSRLRMDAALRSMPPAPRPGTRGRPRQYGPARLSLAKRAGQSRGWQTLECFVYGAAAIKTIKTFLATYPPAGGVIRVVIVREEHGCQYFFATDPTATPREIVEAFADRAAIEQCFHDVKEVWGAGQQQVRNVWANVAAFNLNLWVQTLVECWAWNKPAGELRDRSASPWDDASRRPSHADRRNALRRQTLDNEYAALPTAIRHEPKIHALYQRLRQLAA